MNQKNAFVQNNMPNWENPLNGVKNQENTSNADARPNTTALPGISLPKGGGAIRSMGEKFAANPQTGTATFSIPIYTTPTRANFSPDLSLSYDSGTGNGPFGLGWQLSIPCIQRKTDKGLPRYQDELDTDIYLLSNQEDLVPALVQAAPGEWKLDRSSPEQPSFLQNQSYQVQRYRPRIEGSFTRIERWKKISSGEVHWRSITRDNITSIFGSSPLTRIADPDDDKRVYCWLLELSYDDKGNAITFKYKQENSDNVKNTLHEQNRQIKATRYLKSIQYGNKTPYYPDFGAAQQTPLPAEWFFEVVFDYGEHMTVSPRPQENQPWFSRPDAFSNYRAGFEIRSYRLCRRILMFHSFPDPTNQALLVHSTNFNYSDEIGAFGSISPNYTFLVSASQIGYLKKPDGVFQKSLPPLDFTYSLAEIDSTLHFPAPEELENLPEGVDGTRFRWLDLDGEGLPGILTETAGSWFYKRNRSSLSDVKPFPDTIPVNKTTLKFEPFELVATTPAGGLLSGTRQFFDLTGSGEAQLVQFSASMGGFYERNNRHGWESFRPFESNPNINWNDPNLKLVDLNGDGRADILLSEDEVFCWFPSLATKGFGSAEQVRKARNDEVGPALVFDNRSAAGGAIYLADLSGDGLSDIVRIRNGEVCYWPNLGYGRFGAKITMSDAPWFDYLDLFDLQRLHLADIDGSGTTDLVYTGRNQVTLWFNQSGNSWSKPLTLAQFPANVQPERIEVLDLLGNGTACITWSSPQASHSGQPFCYIDLMGGQKPHLLLSMKNNLGAETRLDYAVSTQFYLQDRYAGKPWRTRLPFPIHVVERVELVDHISGNRFVSHYAYHHGYYDSIEREFRGFGMVEQWDTEEIGVVLAGNIAGPATNRDAASFVAPVYTKTWYHIGAYSDQTGITSQYQDEYYFEPGQAGNPLAPNLLTDSNLPTGLVKDEPREALRALKGAFLRQEIYSWENNRAEQTPFSVSTRNYTLKIIQPRLDQPYAVFFSHPCEALDYFYEEVSAPAPDPRVKHEVTFEVDPFGNVLKKFAIGYGRRHSALLRPEDQRQQTQSQLLYTENRFTGSALGDFEYRLPQLCESRVYELAGSLATEQPRLTPAELAQKAATAQPVDYEVVPDGSLQKRLISHTYNFYRKNDLSGFLPFGAMGSRGLFYESYTLAFTPGILEQTFISPGKILPAPLSDVLQNEGGYLSGNILKSAGLLPAGERDDAWWLPSGQTFYSFNPTDTFSQEFNFALDHFFLAHRLRDPFNRNSRVQYDAYNLLPVLSLDAVESQVTALNDYRTLRPIVVTDPNDNQTVLAYDALGRLVGTALMGKTSQNQGDRLGPDFPVEPTSQQILDFIKDPVGQASALLGQASARIIYELGSFQRSGQPIFEASITREKHFNEVAGPQSPLQLVFTYSDGFSRVIQTKLQAEAGEAPLREASDPAKPDVPGKLIFNNNTVQLGQVNNRWLSQGQVVYNNKGKPVKQYEPFFSATHLYEAEAEVVATGVTSTLFYDVLGRVVGSLHPDHSYGKIVFTPWQIDSWDVNDNVLQANPQADPVLGKFFTRLPQAVYLPTWHAARVMGQKGPEAQGAAARTALHNATPLVTHLDTLGRVFLRVADNAAAGNFEARIKLDLEGNLLAVIDERDLTLALYRYDLTANKLYQNSADAGERWNLPDINGSPIRGWDSLNHRLRQSYDDLRRPTGLFLSTSGATEKLVERTLYGESIPDPKTRNLRGKIYEHFDQAGLVTNLAYDFKGNLLGSTRQLAGNYKDELDWQLNPAPALEAETFQASTTYDALNRPTRLTSPDNSLAWPEYNESNLLKSLKVNLHDERQNGEPVWQDMILRIEYNARGQRNFIQYGNGASTRYSYEPDTFRLSRQVTRRNSDNSVLQDLSYVYDPAGNICSSRDQAQATVFFDNQAVSASSDYIYDAIYRLIEASGREHRGFAANDTPQQHPEWKPHYDFNDATRRNPANPNNIQQLQRYTELYSYDASGNFTSLTHQSAAGNWTRFNQYSPVNNRLLGTSLPGDASGTFSARYSYDLHGNMIKMPHLPLIEWDFKNQLRASQQQIVNDGQGEKTYFVYASDGQRMRKVTERQNGARKSERLYLGALEIYREYSGPDLDPSLERQSLHIMDTSRRIALVDTLTRSNNPPAPLMRFQYGNQLGSTTLELDQQGAIISYEEYYPFGSTAYQSGRSAAEVSLKRYRYIGKERDEETGLYYHGARYYIPWLGRWLNCDPTGMADGPNLYQYARNNPVSLKDSSGTDTDGSDTIITKNEGGVIEGIDKDLNWFRKDAGAIELRRPETNYQVPIYSFEPVDVNIPAPAVPPPDKPDIPTPQQENKTTPEKTAPGPEENKGTKAPEENTQSWKDNDTVQFLAGAALGGLQGWVPGGFIANLAPTPNRNTERGRAVGEMLMGAAQMIVATVGVTGGGLLSVTGLGLLVGAPATVLSAGVFAQGMVNVGSGIVALQRAGSLPAGGGSGGGRSTPKESENTTSKNLDPLGQVPQQSYKGGKLVKYGTKGSVRPDNMVPQHSLSVEVKNYDLTNGTSGLESKVTEQALKRAGELPSGTKQALVIDIRGQKGITDATLNQMFKNINTKTGGLFGDRWWVMMD